MKVIRLTLNFVEAKLPDLSLIDAFDIMLLKFIEEKYGGVAPAGELNAVAVLGALAPKWKEMISLPAIQPLIPEELMHSLTAGLAERELNMRLQKLENLGLLQRINREDREHSKIVLTEIGKAVANFSGIPTNKPLHVIRAYLDRLRIELPPQAAYVLQPNEKVVISVREEIELDENDVCLIFPTIALTLFGSRIANNVILGPYRDRPEFILVGGYIPIVIERGQEIAMAVIIRAR